MTPEQDPEIGRCIFREANDAFFIVHPVDLRVLDANPSAQRLTGFRRKQLLELSLSDLLICEGENDLRALAAACQSTGQFTSADGYFLRTLEGEQRPVHVSASRIHTEPETLGLLVVRDISRQKQAETALRVSEDRFRKLAEEVHAIPWESDFRTWQITYVGPQAAVILGYPCADWYQPNFWVEHLHPEDRNRVIRFTEEASTSREVFELEYRMIAMDGRTVWLHDVVNVIADASGPRQLRGFLIDITKQRRLEEELRQSQKLEAVGRLAGGVAHDFNNLLTVVMGYTDLMLSNMEASSSWLPFIKEIHHAGQRAAELTRQLLAFGRKQILQPRVLDLNEVVRQIEQMIQRLIGEDIRLQTSYHSGLWPVTADPGQLQQVLLNLAANARDAMPRGGRLVISTANTVIDEAGGPTEIRSGPCVTLTISDSGCGMDQETLAQIFDPFFTTKELGKGTGLGLATVYGIIQQSGGHISAASELGRGTTFTIHLPVVEGASPSHDFPLQESLNLPRGTETILLVEDEESVRNLARHILELCGYTVLVASDSDEAQEKSQAFSGPIQLLITDVVMPGMNGVELAQQLLTQRPQLRVIYISGYPGNPSLFAEELKGKAEWLAKPFGPQELARLVRAVLEEKS